MFALLILTMIVNNVDSSYVWRDDVYIRKEYRVTTFENGQKVETVVEFPMYDRRGKEVKEFDPVRTIDKLA